MKSHILMATLAIAGLLVTGCKQEAEPSADVVPQVQSSVSNEIASTAASIGNLPSASTSTETRLLAANAAESSTGIVDNTTGMSEEEAYQAADQTCHDQAQESMEGDSEAVYKECMESLGFSVESGDKPVE